MKFSANSQKYPHYSKLRIKPKCPRFADREEKRIQLLFTALVGKIVFVDVDGNKPRRSEWVRGNLPHETPNVTDHRFPAGIDERAMPGVSRHAHAGAVPGQSLSLKQSLFHFVDTMPWTGLRLRGNNLPIRSPNNTWKLDVVCSHTCTKLRIARWWSSR